MMLISSTSAIVATANMIDSFSSAPETSITAIMLVMTIANLFLLFMLVSFLEFFPC